MQVARGQILQASDMRKKLTSLPVPDFLTTGITQAMEATRGAEPIHLSTPPPTSTPPPQPPSLNQPVISFAPLKTAEDENKKAAAAAVAAKLAASTSSAQMFSSVLSSLVAEEAAKHGSLNSGGFRAGLSLFPPEKRPKLEKPMTVSDDSTPDGGANTTTSYFSPLQQQQVTNMPGGQSTSMQPLSQVNQFAAPPPPPPPLPPLSQANPAGSQFVQSNGMMVGVMPYGFGANTLPPPPPLPPHIAMGLSRPSQSLQQPHPQPQQTQPQQQQQPTTGGYYRPTGIGFYGQNQPSTSPLPRQ